MNFTTFPTTRYQGSKRKIIPWLYSSVKDIEFDTVLDVFGGSASVSYMFKKMYKSVTFNDYLSFNYLIGKAIIENQDVTLTDHDVELILKRSKHLGLLNREFKDIYYLDKENDLIENIVCNISKLNSYENDILVFKKALMYFIIFQTSLIKRPFNLFHRKNLNLRINNVKRSFGNKTSWEGNIEKYVIKFSKEVNNAIFNNYINCKSINYTVLDIPEDNYDLVYLDPPYLRKNSSNETSNYLKCYHFLEGLANYSSWEKIIDSNSRIKQIKNDYKKNLFKVEGIYQLYSDIFYKFRKSKIVLSYKAGGLPSIDYLINELKKTKKKVYSQSIHYKYALNHQNGNAKKNREVLIIGL